MDEAKTKTTKKVIIRTDFMSIGLTGVGIELQCLFLLIIATVRDRFLDLVRILHADRLKISGFRLGSDTAMTAIVSYNVHSSIVS